MATLAYHLNTLFLFSKSDIKTTVIPVSVFATAVAPLTSLERLPHVIFWLWFHVLQFSVSNQLVGAEEDALNKPYRPLHARRITMEQAIILRWVLVPSCLALSACYSPLVVVASLSLCVLTYIYNEMGMHSYWVGRHILNGLGFASFEMGSTLLASADPTKLDSIAMLAIAINASMFATTIQTQDFKDCDGDCRIGRQTLPILFPEIARFTVLPTLLAWSISLTSLWKVEATVGLPFAGLALFIGMRFIMKRDVPADQTSFYIYNIWLSIAHGLPAYWRLRT